jgi:hypothetical protein
VIDRFGLLLFVAEVLKLTGECKECCVWVEIWRILREKAVLHYYIHLVGDKICCRRQSQSLYEFMSYHSFCFLFWLSSRVHEHVPVSIFCGSFIRVGSVAARRSLGGSISSSRRKKLELCAKPLRIFSRWRVGRIQVRECKMALADWRISYHFFRGKCMVFDSQKLCPFLSEIRNPLQVWSRKSTAKT